MSKVSRYGEIALTDAHNAMNELRADMRSKGGAKWEAAIFTFDPSNPEAWTYTATKGVTAEQLEVFVAEVKRRDAAESESAASREDA